MHPDLELSALKLARGSAQRIDDGQGLLVKVLDGRLWLTQEGDQRDVVLDRGDQALIQRNGLSVLSALRDARYLLLVDPSQLEH